MVNDEQRDRHVAAAGGADRPPRRGPAQPRRSRWRETIRDGDAVDAGEAPGDDSPSAEPGPERRHGPPPSRRSGATTEFQPAPPEDAIPDSEDASFSALARPPLITGAVLTVLAVLVLLITLFAFAQAVMLYNEIAALPDWLRPFAYGLLGLLSAALIYFGGRVVWLYMKLRVSPRLSLAAEDLKRRDRVRDELREQRLGDARQTLTAFLDAYGISARDRAALIRLGATETMVNQLESARHVLVARHAVTDDSAWLQRFQTEFLEPLDELARLHTRRLIRQVFVGTSIAPRGTLDTLVVLTLCYRLIADLCVIYRVRAGRWETAIMLAHVLVNLLTASQADEVGGEIGSQAGELLDASFDAIPGIISGIASEFIGRGAEGGVNALLLWRLSVRAQNYLRPIRKRPESPPQPA